MAQNNDGPGKRLKREEAKNVSFGFMRPKERTVAQPSTTSVYQPTPEIAESRIYLKNRDDFKNKVVANIANAYGANVRYMNPEQYKKVAAIVEELNNKYGSPSWQKYENRAFYNGLDNSINFWPELDKDPSANFEFKNKNRPDIYFQELAHAAQVQKNPIKSAIRALKGIALYEDSKKPNVGRYGTPGEFEYEAHSEIAPRLWNEFKTLYKQKYGEDAPPQYENRYEVSQLIANTPKAEGGTLKFKGKMLPEIEVVQPVKRP